MWSYLWIALGGALGSAGRFWVSRCVAERWGESFPVGTLVVNVVGSLVIGCFAAATAPEGRWLVSPAAREFVMIGVLGGFTTFSSFSLQTLHLLREGEWLHAAANIVLSVALCLLGVWLGHACATALNSGKGA